eukprot:7137686-Pyramimonas_sp.AAC.1
MPQPRGGGPRRLQEGRGGVYNTPLSYTPLLGLQEGPKTAPKRPSWASWSSFGASKRALSGPRGGSRRTAGA